jgi:drug/metabolite transporter (DMT)-like permease
MIGLGIWQGERLARLQWLGLVLALAGLVGLMLPGLTAPPLLGAALMVLAGAAWGVYSLRGKGEGDPTLVTAGNFWRAAVMALALSAVMQVSTLLNASWDAVGLAYAVASGAVTSGLGYALWYSVLPALKATQAATIQLSVPVIAAFGGVALLGEVMTEQFVLASAATLGGIALVIWGKGS